MRNSRTYLSVGDEDVVTPSKSKGWKYLEKIADEIIQTENFSIGILIGVLVFLFGAKGSASKQKRWNICLSDSAWMVNSWTSWGKWKWCLCGM